jgi:hypothetical protein
MRWLRPKINCAVIFCALTVACWVGPAALTAAGAAGAAESTKATVAGAAEQPAASFKAVPFKVLATGRAPGQQPAGFLSARDAKTFRQIWSDLHLEDPLPKVNFKRQMVVAWTGGGAACDGYKLTHVREDADGVSLEIEHSHPRLHQMCIALYAPSHLVAAIPQTAKPVKFFITEIPRT